MRSLILLDSVIADLHEAYINYEQALPGLGERFLDTWHEHCAHLLAYPQAASLYRKNIRQGRLPGFPYLIMYKVYAHEVVVLSLIHNKQHPTKRTRKRQ